MKKRTMNKRRYTRWIFEACYAQDTGIRVGYIYNKTDGNPDDVICVEICGLKGIVEFNCRIDEAVILAAGLNKVAGQMLVGQLPLGGKADEQGSKWAGEQDVQTPTDASEGLR